MSRSIHKTVKGVFGGKSKSEINKMFEEEDPNIQDLFKKSEYKMSETEKRKEKKFHRENSSFGNQTNQTEHD